MGRFKLSEFFNKEHGKIQYNILNSNNEVQLKTFDEKLAKELVKEWNEDKDNVR